MSSFHVFIVQYNPEIPTRNSQYSVDGGPSLAALQAGPPAEGTDDQRGPAVPAGGGGPPLPTSAQVPVITELSILD